MGRYINWISSYFVLILILAASIVFLFFDEYRLISSIVFLVGLPFLFVLTIPLIYWGLAPLNRFFTYAENFYPKGLELKIINGQLTTNVKEPYIFDLEKNKQPADQRHLLIIDTQGSIENYPKYNTYILATKNAVVYPSESKNNRIEQTSVFYFRDLKQNLTLNKNIYDKFLSVARPYVPRIPFFVDYIILIFLFLFLIFGSLFWTGGVMFGLLFLTFFVWIVNLIFKKKYSYGSLFKMGMHAVTWPILISEAVKYLKLPFSGFYAPIYLVLMLIVLFSSEK